MFDRWTSSIAADGRRRRLWSWLAPTLITLLAVFLRTWNLGHPHELVFDETYYVKDAWSQWVLGFSSTWPEGANESFEAGDTDVFTGNGSFVVHPPLGKALIGLGMAMFGADSSFGWRFATAVLGSATVLVLYFVAKALTNSIVFASVAGLLLTVDGLAIVLSRVALLDGILTFFIVLTFWFVVLDRRRHADRVAALISARTGHHGVPEWGPVLWNRPWVIAAGAAAGAAASVKWSGFYLLAGVGIYLVVTDALVRRHAGVRPWPTDAILRQGPATFVLLVPVAFAVYLASWTGWLVTDGGYSRHAAEEVPVTGFWSWVPTALQSLWIYHRAIYDFHIGLSADHSYESPAWQWPLLVRPTSMFFRSDAAGEGGCFLANGCVQNIYSMPNPLTWWAGIAAVIYLVYRFIVARDWRHAVVLTGVAVTYVPWVLYPERTIFQFYTVVMLPFLALALTFALRAVAAPPGADVVRRRSGQLLVGVFLAVVLLLSVFWYPVLTATPVPYDLWRAHNWLPTWV